MKKSELPRINVIHRNDPIDKEDDVTQKMWRPIIEEMGFDERMTNMLCRYAKQHALIDSMMAPGGNDTLFDGTNTIIPPSIPTPEVQSLPLVLKILRKIDLTGKRIIIVQGPFYEMLIGDNMYIDEIPSIFVEFEMPPDAVRNTATNLMEIYEERMVEKFSNRIIEYIESVPNADTLAVCSFGNLMWTNYVGPDLTARSKMIFTFRMRAFEDATFLPGNRPGARDVQTWMPVKYVLESNNEPGRFKRWLVKLLFGAEFKQCRN